MNKLLYFRRNLAAIVVMTVTALVGWGAIPQGYYNNLNGKSGEELKTAAHKIINPHTTPGSTSAYNTYYTNLRVTFQQTDLYPNSNRWWDMYSDIPFYAPSFTGLNREHSVPKSWWGYDKNSPTPPYVDLNHLYPSEMKANTAKSNYPLGVVQSSSFDNGICKVGSPASGQGGGAAKVFEPDNTYKGDFARTYFYMITCYQGMTWKYTYMFNNSTYPGINKWALDMLLDWARRDPVSQKEYDRNEAVYKLQNNRNPFIDFPDLFEYIWGNKVGQPFKVTDTPDVPSGDPVLITPVQDMALDFGEVAVGSSVTRLLHFKGENLTGALTINLSKRVGNPEMFSVGDKEIKAQYVNRENGYDLVVTYTPTAVGEHTARLIVSDITGMEGTLGVELRGDALAVPTLTALTATEPTEIESDSYVANWNEPTEVVDYYIVTRTKYVGGVPTTEELLAEQSSLKIEGFSGSDSESYAVQSVRLGYRSPMSNTVFVSHSGITGVNEELPLGVTVYPGLIRITTGVEHTDGRIYDLSGHQVMSIGTVTDGMEITLPLGVYFLVTGEHTTPVKIIAR